MIPAPLSWLTRFVASVASMSCVLGAGRELDDAKG